MTFFHSSTLASDKLNIVQKVLEVGSELTIGINECPRAPCNLTAEKFTVIEKIIGLLEPLK